MEVTLYLYVYESISNLINKLFLKKILRRCEQYLVSQTHREHNKMHLCNANCFFVQKLWKISFFEEFESFILNSCRVNFFVQNFIGTEHLNSVFS